MASLDGFCAVEITGLRRGARLQLPIHDQEGVLLLAAGQYITETFLDRLNQRGLHQIQVHQSELPRIYAGRSQGTATTVSTPQDGYVSPERNDRTDRLDEALADPAVLSLPVQDVPLLQSCEQHGATAYDGALFDEMNDSVQERVTKVGDIFSSFVDGRGLDLDGLGSIADEAVADLKKDRDLFNCLGINPFSEGYPARHAMHTCMLSLSVGAQLQLDRGTLKELALGCLFHDSGMLLIDQKIQQLNRPLTRIEFLEITKHPVKIFDKLRKAESIPTRAAFIALQIHERNNGSGYPRRRETNQIHFLSKVAAVADTYVAMVSPRPHRAGILPHRAIEELVSLTNQGLFDPSALRALLETVSLYPIGSCIALNDGRVARVLRANGTEFDRPILEVFDRGRLADPPEIVDLLEHPELQIDGALPTLDADPREAPYVSSPASNPRLLNLLTVLDAADAALDHQYRPLRKNARRPFRGEIRAYANTAPPGHPPAWISHPGVARNMSSGGMAIVLPQDGLRQTLVIVLPTRTKDDTAVLAQIMRCEKVAEGFWEYGVKFIGVTKLQAQLKSAH